MAKSKRKQSGQPAPPPPPFPGAGHVSLGYDPQGKMEPVDVVGSKEAWSEYTLGDGSIIRAKAVVLDVKRAVGQFNPEGDPIYVMQLVFVNQVNAPDRLKKGE